MEDKDIISLFRKRSEDAIHETAKKYGKYCHYIAYNILYNEQDSEECVNDTYFNAWESIPPHNPDKLSSYLGKITRNLALNKWDYYNADKRGKGRCAHMNEKRILELFNTVNEEYINEANPQNKKHHKFKITPIAVAACLCLLVIGGWRVSYFMKTPVTEKYYITNMEEVLSVYEGVLLAENISLEEANDTNMMLCYTGNGLPLSSEEWKTLSVSANFDDYDMTLNCAFNGEDFAINEEDAIDIIQYGDTTIHIYQAENTTEYDLAYYAVFEYQNVCYELHTYSNDKENIYDILQAVLGVTNKECENTSNGEHNFTEVLGYSDYYVKVEQSTPGFIIQKYYIEVEGIERCIAQVFGYAVPEPEVYSRDLDGDGINELICNCMFGTGAERVYVYRNNDGVIELGRLAYDLWDSTLFPGITNTGSSYIQENYIAETGIFEIAYPTETGYESIILENMDVFEFEEFVEEL